MPLLNSSATDTCVRAENMMLFNHNDRHQQHYNSTQGHAAPERQRHRHLNLNQNKGHLLLLGHTGHTTAKKKHLLEDSQRSDLKLTWISRATPKEMLCKNWHRILFLTSLSRMDA
jgi:hypothetical protein